MLLDSAFRPALDGSVRALLVEPDSRILLGGEFQKVNGQSRKGIAGLNPDGSLDSEFLALGTAGVNSFSVYCLAEQLDGKILVGGTFDKLEGQARPISGDTMATELWILIFTQSNLPPSSTTGLSLRSLFNRMVAL